MPVYRTIQVDTLDALRDVTVQAERAYLRLALGRFSTRTGIVKYNARDLASEARLRPSELEAALAELERSGHILRAENAPAVYLLGFCSAFAPRPVDNRRSWLVELGGCKYANLASQAMKEIEDAQATGGPVGTRRGAGGYPVAPLQEQEQEQEQNRINSTPLPTVTAPTGATAPAKERKERAPRTIFAEPTEQETLVLVEALVPTLQPFRQERIATACYSYWQSAGWKRKSGPIKDWPATVRTWVTNQADRDKDVSVALASKPSKAAAPTASKAFPFYASNGKGLNAPEFIHPTLGPTEMTREEFDADQAKLPAYMRAPPC